jgi:hypothetical protein
LIQLKTFLALTVSVTSCEKESFVNTTDIVTLVALTALFAAFAATMVGVEIFLRRHAPARSPAGTSSQRKGRLF